MKDPRAHRGSSLVETLATCALVALAMAMGAALLAGAGDPIPRAEQTLLEVHGVARLVAMSDGPATIQLERGTLVVRDGRGDLVVERDWPEDVHSTALIESVRIDRHGRSEARSIRLVHGARRVEIVP